MSKFDLTTTQPEVIEPPQESDRAHLFTHVSGAVLPLEQAVITGTLFGVLVVVWLWVAGSLHLWKMALAVGSTVTVAMWAAMIWRWAGLTRPLERLVNWDLNGDGIIGYEPKTIRIEFKADKNQTIIANLPDGQMERLFYEALVRGDKCGIHNWTGRGKPLTPKQYETIRDTLLSRQFARWVGDPGGRDGWELTPYGRHALRAIVSPSPTAGEDGL